MNIIKKVVLKFEGKKYEIIATQVENGYTVRAFFDNKPANPWIYIVDFITNMDFEKAIGESAYDHLIEYAKSDIVKKRYETLLADIKKITDHPSLINSDFLPKKRIAGSSIRFLTLL